MFFLVWGTKTREESPGVVADLCPYCCDVRPFDVIDTYRVTHVYYVGLGRGTFGLRSRRCRGCRRHLAFDPSAYAGPVSQGASHHMSAGEMLAVTNPGLARRIAELVRLETLATSTAYRGTDGRFAECLQWARWLSSASLSEETLHALGEWPSLDDDARDRLLAALRRAGAELRDALLR